MDSDFNNSVPYLSEVKSSIAHAIIVYVTYPITVKIFVCVHVYITQTHLISIIYTYHFVYDSPRDNTYFEN